MKKATLPERRRAGCLVCGSELVYLDSPEELECIYCHTRIESVAKCKNGHYVCDECHRAPADDLIMRHCVSSESVDPVESALVLMSNPAINMHGPEHHILVPAVLLMAYYNAKKEPWMKKDKIKEARRRAANLLGGFCGFYGDCGAAVGTGIFVSIITGSTPLSKKEWRLSNLMTARALLLIAENGGPRCCKRNTFLALMEATKFTKEHFGIEFHLNGNVKCSFGKINPQCLEQECLFHQ